MSLIKDLVEGNRRFVEQAWDERERELVSRPSKQLAVVACMDTRYNVERVLGLQHGDAKIIRNAGNIVDDGTLRSLIIAVHLMQVEHVAIMGHTKCAMTTVGRGEFRIANNISKATDVPLHELMRPDFQRWLGGFDDVEGNVRRSIGLVRGHPYMPKSLQVFGLIYDNDTGFVREIQEPAATAAGKPTARAPGTGRRLAARTALK